MITPEQLVEDIRAEFGPAAAAVAEIWVRSAGIAEALRLKQASEQDILLVLKHNVMTVVRLTNLPADVFGEIVARTKELLDDDVILH